MLGASLETFTSINMHRGPLRFTRAASTDCGLAGGAQDPIPNPNASELKTLKLGMCPPQADVDEALRLMRMSKASLLDGAGAGRPERDPVSLVYEALRDDAQRSGRATYTWADLRALLGHKFTVRALGTPKP